MHGDETPVVGRGKAWGKGMTIVSWQSMVVTGPTILKTMLAFVMFCAIQSVRQGHHTMDEVFKKLVCSFTALWEGTWPLRDWLGNKLHNARTGLLAGGYFCPVWDLIGDLDYWRDKLKLANSKANMPCCLCPCSSTITPWYHFSPGARWMQLIYDIIGFQAAGWSNCWLFQIPGVTVYTLHPDWMHGKHLGSDKVLGGSVLYILIFCILQWSPEENLIQVWQDILVIYKSDGVKHRFGNLRVSMCAVRV